MRYINIESCMETITYHNPVCPYRHITFIPIPIIVLIPYVALDLLFFSRLLYDMQLGCNIDITYYRHI